MLRSKIEDILSDDSFASASLAASDSDAEDTVQKEDLQVSFYY